jgi:hypothetical protein
MGTRYDRFGWALHIVHGLLGFSICALLDNALPLLSARNMHTHTCRSGFSSCIATHPGILGFLQPARHWAADIVLPLGFVPNLVTTGLSVRYSFDLLY